MIYIKTLALSTTYITICLLLINCSSKKDTITKIPRKYQPSNNCRYKERPNPFIMYISDYFIVDDSLILNINIFNNSDSLEILSRNIIDYKLLNDTFLKHDKYVFVNSRPILRNTKEYKINCKNCFSYYKESKYFQAIKSKNTLKIIKSFKILNLDKINSNYSFLIKLYTNVPGYLNNYCPRIWTGNISCISQININ